MTVNLDDPPQGSFARATPLANHHVSPMTDIIHIPEVETVQFPQVALPKPLAPVVTKGKFFFVDGEKFFVKGVTLRRPSG